MRLGWRFSRFISHWIFILGGRGRVYGVERVPRTGPVILACNHQSFLDPIIAALALPREAHFMARDTLFRNRWFGGIIDWFHAFPVRRGTADVGAIKESLRRLKAGAALVTFPEGTRTRDGRIEPLQPGIVGIAKRARCPIVPTIIEGAYEMWPRHQTLPGCGHVRVLYGRPLAPQEFTGADPDQIARELTRRLRELHNELRHRMGRPPLAYEDESTTGAAASNEVD